MLKHQSPNPTNLSLPPKGEKLLTLTTIDGDIKNQATDFVKKQFSVIPFINDKQKEQIARWLGEHVQAERHGWSKKLELSIKEIERQRRVALLSNSRIQTINAQVEHVIQKEASAADAKFIDDSYDPIQELEQNVMTLCELAVQLFDDRTQCFKLLGISEKQMHNYGYFADSLREKLKSFEAEIKTLKGENNSELQTPRSRGSNMSREGQGMPPQRAGAGKRIKKKSEPPDRFLSLKPVETVVNLVPLVVSHEVDLEKRITVSKDVKKRKDLGAGKKKVAKDVDAYSDKRVKSDPDLKILKSELQKPKPISEQEKTQKQERLIEEMKNEMRELEKLVSQKDKDLEKYKQHIKTLKHMYHYGNLGLKGGKIKEPNFMKTNDAAKFMQKDSLSVMSQSLPSIAHEHLNHNVNNNNDSDELGLSLDSVLFPPAKTSVSRCLRCRRLYRLQDNHKKACRYHPKAKRKVERYSDNGKLQTVTFVWDCCNQDFDHEGCCADEHI